MSWLHPFFLLGLTLAAVPIFLHLFGRKSEKKIVLPTIELLKKACAVHQQRSRFREFLLLLLRTSFIVFITLAASRPYFSSVSAPNEKAKGRDFFILIDNSLSMSAQVKDEAYLDRAIKRAKHFIAGTPPGSRFHVQSLFTSSSNVLGLTNDRKRARYFIDHIEATYRTGGFSSLLRRVVQLASNSSSSPEIWVFTDGTALPWMDVSITNEGLPIPIRIFDVSEKGPFNNFGIQKLTASTIWKQARPSFQVELLATSSPQAKAKSEVAIDLFEKGEWKTLDKGFLPASPRPTAHRFLFDAETDPVIGRVRLQGDALAADNLQPFLISQAEQKKVLILNGQPEADRRKDPAFFLRSVLGSQKETGEKGVFVVQEEPLTDMALEELKAFDLVILADGAMASKNLVRNLRRFMESGGNILLGAGDSFLSQIDNFPLKRLLPFSLRVAQDAGGNQSFHLHSPSNSSSELFAFLLPRWDELLHSAKFRKILLTSEEQGSDVWIRFDHGPPALLHARYSQGRIAFWTSSFSLAWNDFPLTSGYPAFFRRLVHELARTENDQPVQLIEGVAGEELSLKKLNLLPGDVARIEKVSKGRKDFEPPRTMKWALPNEVGIFQIRSRSQKDQKDAYVISSFASAESDFRSLKRSDLEEQLKGLKVIWNESASSNSLRAGVTLTEESEKSGIFALLAFLALLVESIVAGRLPFRRRVEVASASVLLFCLFLPFNAFSLGFRSQIELARVEHPSGTAAPHNLPLHYLLKRVRTMANIEPASQVAKVKLSDPRIFDYPFLYWPGDREFPAPNQKEMQHLRQHLRSGGFLFFDDSTGRDSGAFRRSVEKLVKELFPAKKLTALSSKHSLFRSFYLLSRPWGRKEKMKRLYGIEANDRTSLIYFPGDLGGALSQDLSGRFTNQVDSGFRQRQMALRFGINILMYTLTLDYKQDQIHIPFILDRRG